MSPPESGVHETLATPIADPSRRSPTRPHIADTAIGDGTNVKSRFNQGPGVEQFNRLTGETEIMPHDPDAKTQWQKDNDGKPVKSTTAGTPFTFLHATTGFTGEMFALSVDNVPSGPGESEIEVSKAALRRLVDRLPGFSALLYDKAAHGEDIEDLLGIGVHLHARVTLANKAKNIPKEKLTDVGLPARLGGEVIGHVDIVARGGAANIRVNLKGEWHLVLLEPGQVHERRSRADGTITRLWRDYTIPVDDPRVPKRLRGAVVEVRHTANKAEREAGFNRAEVLRLIAEDHADWDVVVQRNRAECLNQWVKRHWPDKRGPAVGKQRQQMRLAFAAIGLNIIAALRYQERTGIDLLGPPGSTATIAA